MQIKTNAHGRHLNERNKMQIIKINILKTVISSISVFLCLQSAYTNAQQQGDCFEGQFQCDSGHCISAKRLCDSFKDCADGSDETFVQCYDSKCSDNYFRCTYGGCYESFKMCDGKQDCWDGTDENELECSLDTNYYDKKIRGDCRGETYAQIQCKESKECIFSSQLCDGVVDCRDNSDESNEFCLASVCPAGSFQCAYGACIAQSAACNHIIDCRDESDEVPAICRKLKNKNEWYPPSWQKKHTTSQPNFNHIPTTSTTSTSKPHIAKKSCNVTGTALRLRTMYNGLPYLGDGFIPHQTTVRLSCNHKHALDGSDVNTCDDGEWKAPWAECIKKCSPRAIINDPSIQVDCSYNNNIIDCATDLLVVGTRATVKCAQGYTPTGSIAQGERICGSNGTWVRFSMETKNLKCIPDCGRTFETVKEFPWLISVFKRGKYNKYNFRCLGAIIDPFYVLTVANCFLSTDPPLHTDYIVVMGNQSVGFNPTQEHGYETRNIAQIEVNEFKPLALLKIINPFILSAKERPICLQRLPERYSRWNGEPLGQPIVKFKGDKQKYFLEHMADNNTFIYMNHTIIDRIKVELQQNEVKY